MGTVTENKQGTESKLVQRSGQRGKVAIWCYFIHCRVSVKPSKKKRTREKNPTTWKIHRIVNKDVLTFLLSTMEREIKSCAWSL